MRGRVGVIGEGETGFVDRRRTMHGIYVVACAYFFLLLPARREYVKREAERREQQAKLAELQTKSSEITNNANAAGDLMGSVERFETKYLTP